MVVLLPRFLTFFWLLQWKQIRRIEGSYYAFLTFHQRGHIICQSIFKNIILQKLTVCLKCMKNVSHFGLKFERYNYEPTVYPFLDSTLKDVNEEA